MLASRLNAERSDIVDLEGHADLTPDASPVVNMCNHIIARAIDVGASDVHLECTRQGTTGPLSHFCGVLEPVLTLPATASQPIRNRFKIMAKADIAVHHRP